MDFLEKIELFEEQQEQGKLKLIYQELNFIKCEIKTIKNENKNIRNKINNNNIKSKAIEIIKINKPNKPKLTKNETNMSKVVNEFKNIDFKTYLIKVPEDILNSPRPETNPNSYNKFKLKQSVEV